MSLTKGRREEVVANVTRANEIMTEAHKRVSDSFASPVVSNVGDPQRLARRLSEKWEKLRITISFVNGRQTVMASPLEIKFSVPESLDKYNSESTEAAAAHAVLRADAYWPTFAEVAAYAVGYNDNSSHDELERLRSENKRLREDCLSMRMMGPPGRYY